MRNPCTSAVTSSALLLLLAAAGCGEDPVDAALDAALDFSGIFEASDGLQIELDGEMATVVTPGSTAPFSLLEPGDPFLIEMERTGPRTWQGLGFVKIDGAGTAVVTLTEEAMTLNSDIPAHRSWTRTTGGSGGSGGGAGGGSSQIPSTLDAASSCDDWWKVLSSKPTWRITYVGYRYQEDGRDRDLSHEWKNATWSFYMKDGSRTMRSTGWSQWSVPQSYDYEASAILQRWDTPTNQCRLSTSGGPMEPGPIQFPRSWDGKQVVMGYGTWPKAVVIE